MTDRENLPALSNQQVVVHTVQRGSLVMRGLLAVQMSTLAKADDALYRQARDDYNRITLYGSQTNNRFRKLCSTDGSKLKAAFEAFQRLANNNYGKAYYPLSVLYLIQGEENSKDRAQHFNHLAIEWCIANEVNNQDVELWCDLGDICRVDGAMAEYWYRKAAEQGHANAQTGLGILYERGHGVQQDDEQAAKWYRKAAEQGHARAQYFLGWKYEKGQGVTQDDKQAVEWYRKAAEQGHAAAQQYLEAHGIDWRKQDAS